MMTFEIYSLLLRLKNSPGLYLHKYWWQTWKMDLWAVKYQSLSLVSKKIIDHQIDEMRGDIPDITLDLTNFQFNLLMSFPVLEKIMISMGILMLKCPDYLFSRQYRETLLSRFTMLELEYLMACWPGGAEPPAYPAGDFMDKAFAHSCCALSTSFPADPVWGLMKYTMPDFKQLAIQESFDTELFNRIRKFI